jgi:hypothetical protein
METIYPDVVKTGYITFKDVPIGLTGKAKIIIGEAYDEYFNKITYEFSVEL